MAPLGATLPLVQLAAGVSGIGDGLVLAAFPLLAASLTDDPRLVVAVTVAARLPWLLVSLPAGALVDRRDRRRLVITVELARAVLLAAFAVTVVTGQGALGALLVTVFLIGVGQTFIASATHAVVPGLVDSRRLGDANGVLFATQTSTENLIGPALGGLLFAAVASLPFILDGISFALAAALMAVALPVVARGAGPKKATASLHADIAAGFAYFMRTPILRLVGALVASLAFCQAIVFGPLVLFALHGLGLSATGYGILLAVAAVGNVAGGMVAGRLDHRFGARILLPASGVVAAAAYRCAAWRRGRRWPPPPSAPKRSPSPSATWPTSPCASASSRTSCWAGSATWSASSSSARCPWVPSWAASWWRGSACGRPSPAPRCCSSWRWPSWLPRSCESSSPW